VLSTPPAFVLSQNQTLQTKTINPQRATANQRKSDQSKTPKTGIKNNHTPKREKEAWQKQQQTKTTKHTIEFSNNTPALQATPLLYSTWTETSNPVLQS
jgi:hypothetical protein